MLLDLLFAGSCAGCGAAGPSPCGPCVAAMEPSPPVPVPPPLHDCRALLTYDGAAREVVARIKYRNARATVRWLASGMAGLLVPAEVDVVTWAPTTARRRHDRGFDHAELLARAVARELRRPCRPLLVRGPGPPQTGRSSQERRWGPRFTCRAPVHASRVALVDDVVTTGATLAAAGLALQRAGAARTLGLAAAHRP